MNWKDEFLDTVIQGDCLEKLKEIPDNSIDLIVTSPPYNCEIEYDSYDDNKNWDDYLKWCNQWVGELYRVMKPDGRLCLNVLIDMGLDKNKKRVSPFSAFDDILRVNGIKSAGTAFWTDNHRSKNTAWGSWRSASCIFPGAITFTDRGYENIDDTVVGFHRTLTNDGTFCTINKHKKMLYKGDAIEIKTGLGKLFDTILTLDHPVLSVKHDHVLKLDPNYKRADSLKGRDYVCYPLKHNLNKKECDNFFADYDGLNFSDNKFWEFIGTYLAEGNLRFEKSAKERVLGRKILNKTVKIGYNNRLSYKKYLRLWKLKKSGKSLNKIAEIMGYSNRRYVKTMWSKIRHLVSIQWKFFDRVLSGDVFYKAKNIYSIFLTVNINEFKHTKKVIDDAGFNCIWKEFPDTNSVRFDISNKKLYMFLLNFYKDDAISTFGTKAHLKIIPEIIFSISNDKLMSIYDGYHYGDGCDYVNDGYVKKNLSVDVSTSKDLLFSIQRILLINGYMSNISQNNTNYNKGVGRVFYSLTLTHDRVRSCIIIDDKRGYVYIPIKKVNRLYDQESYVHDLNIGKNKNFIVGGFIVHNCPYTYLPYEVIMLGYKEQWSKKEKGISTISKQDFMMGCSGLWGLRTQTQELTKANFSTDLPELCIRLFSYKDSIVLDPFMGAWTTAVAAKKLHRHFVGFEISEEYCKVGQNRVNGTTPIFESLLLEEHEESKLEMIQSKFEME